MQQIMAKTCSYPFNLSAFLIAVLVPILAATVCHFAIGNKLRGLIVGVVNHEVLIPVDCVNQFLVASEPNDLRCNWKKLSCGFLQEIDHELAEKVAIIRNSMD